MSLVCPASVLVSLSLDQPLPEWLGLAGRSTGRSAAASGLTETAIRADAILMHMTPAPPAPARFQLISRSDSGLQATLTVPPGVVVRDIFLGISLAGGAVLPEQMSPGGIVDAAPNCVGEGTHLYAVETSGRPRLGEAEVWGVHDCHHT